MIAGGQIIVDKVDEGDEGDEDGEDGEANLLDGVQPVDGVGDQLVANVLPEPRARAAG